MAELSARVGWLTIGETIDLWPTAPGEDGDGFALLAGLLGAAHEVLALRAVPVRRGLPVPERYKQAQLLYTKHLYARHQAGDGEAAGPDGLQLSTYPLVLEAFSLLRQGRSPLRGLR